MKNVARRGVFLSLRIFALAKNRQAKARFDKLSYSHKKEYVDWVQSAKGEATKARRIEKALAMLASGQKLSD